MGRTLINVVRLFVQTNLSVCYYGNKIVSKAGLDGAYFGQRLIPVITCIHLIMKCLKIYTQVSCERCLDLDEAYICYTVMNIHQ